MTMSKIQFAALLLTAGVVGAGVGWLPQWIHKRKHEAPPQVTVGPIVVPPAPSANDEFKVLLAAFLEARLAERQAAPAPREIKTTVAAEVKAPVRYQGKPVSEWLALFRDRDPDTCRKAIDALAAIAEVDRSVIPALIDRLKDKDDGIVKIVARYLGELNPPARETVPLLVRGNLELDTILELLTKIDPKGEVAVPLARSLLQDERLRVCAGFILLTYDKDTSLPIPLLVEALEGRGSVLYFKDGEKEPAGWCSQQALAAWHLRRLGRPVPEAVPQLVNALAYHQKRQNGSSSSDSPFVAVLKTDNEVDWFAATLTSVDPEGKQAIPLLLKMLGDRKFSQDRRCDVARALGHYGSKAKSVTARLHELLKDKEALQEAPNVAQTTYVPSFATEMRDPTQPLREAITETLAKIAPTKEPPPSDD